MGVYKGRPIFSTPRDLGYKPTEVSIGTKETVFSRDRSLSIGASDSAALYGIGYGNALELYYKKTQPENFPYEPSWITGIGNELEPAILLSLQKMPVGETGYSEVATNKGTVLVRGFASCQETYVHASIPFMTATPDCTFEWCWKSDYQDDKNLTWWSGLADFKTTRKYDFVEKVIWGGDYFNQIQHQMAVASSQLTEEPRYELGFVTSLNIVSGVLLIYIVWANERYILDLEQTIIEFWGQHIASKVPPTDWSRQLISDIEYIEIIKEDGMDIFAVTSEGEEVTDCGMIELGEVYDYVKFARMDKSGIPLDKEQKKKISAEKRDMVIAFMERNKITQLYVEGEIALKLTTYTREQVDDSVLKQVSPVTYDEVKRKTLVNKLQVYGYE